MPQPDKSEASPLPLTHISSTTTMPTSPELLPDGVIRLIDTTVHPFARKLVKRPKSFPLALAKVADAFPHIPITNALLQICDDEKEQAFTEIMPEVWDVLAPGPKRLFIGVRSAGGGTKATACHPSVDELFDDDEDEDLSQSQLSHSQQRTRRVSFAADPSASEDESGSDSEPDEPLQSTPTPHRQLASKLRQVRTPSEAPPPSASSIESASTDDDEDDAEENPSTSSIRSLPKLRPTPKSPASISTPTSTKKRKRSQPRRSCVSAAPTSYYIPPPPVLKSEARTKKRRRVQPVLGSDTIPIPIQMRTDDREDVDAGGEDVEEDDIPDVDVEVRSKDRDKPNRKLPRYKDLCLPELDADGSMYEGTLVWAKVEAWPWWPAVTYDEANKDNEIPHRVLSEYWCAKEEQKKGDGEGLYLIRFFEENPTNNWAFVTKRYMRMLGNDDDYDRTMLSISSPLNKLCPRWTDRAIRRECRDAYLEAKRRIVDAVAEAPPEPEGR